MRILIIVFAVLLVLLGGLWLASDRNAGDQEIPVPGAEPVRVPDPRPSEPPRRPPPTPAAQPQIVLPDLDASDVFLRERLAEVDLPEGWLDREDLVRRLAVVIENAGRGEYPRRQLGFLAPSGRFRVVEKDGRLFVDPENYRRFDVYLDALEGVDPGFAADLLSLIEPLLDAAMGELGSEAPVSGQIDAAMAEVMAVPDLDGEVELLQPTVFYEYADPALEALSPLQKQVLRMGPENAARLKRYLSEVAVALQDDATGG
jgi:hypothetical protein